MLGRIRIQNYRGIRDSEVSFDKGINLIVGENGTGKSSILSAISVLLGAAAPEMNELEMLFISENDVHHDVKKIGDAVYSIKRDYPVLLSGSLSFDGIECEIQRRIDLAERGLTKYENKPTKSGECLKQKSDSGELLPLFIYQRFDREWKIPKNDNNEITIRTGLIKREDGYKFCLRGSDNEKDIYQWCLKMAMMQFERNEEIKEFVTFHDVVSHFLCRMEKRDSLSVRYSTEIGSLMFEDGNKNIPISELSTGYKALIHMVIEMAYRAVVLNPMINSDMSGLEGVVLIDEIDAHLHPRWQWRVLTSLKETFPDVQFIVATHSPIVISSAKNARIISMDDDGKAEYLQEAYGYAINDVLSLRQHSGYIPDIAAGYYEKLEKSINEGNKEGCRLVLSEAEREFGVESGFYDELKRYYELNRILEG